MTSHLGMLSRGALLAATLLSSAAGNAAPLPGGASSLVETYDDWGVVCVMQGNIPGCVVRQVQSNSQTKQTVMAMEVGKAPDGKFRGVLLLPLGLTLAQGADLMIDDADLGNALPFSTCVPQGCLVPLTFEADTIAKLKVGKALNIAVSPIGTSQPLPFTVSLKGFSGAMARVADLAK